MRLRLYLIAAGMNWIGNEAPEEEDWIIVLEDVQSRAKPHWSYESVTGLKKILVVSRNPEVGQSFIENHNAVTLTGFSREDAVILLSRTMREPSRPEVLTRAQELAALQPESKKLMEGIVNMLEYHPFAIAQGGYAIQQHRTTLADFEVKFKESRGMWFSDPGFQRGSEHGHNLYSSFSTLLKATMEIEQGEQEDQDRSNARLMMPLFLQFLSVFDTETIQAKIVQRALAHSSVETLKAFATGLRQTEGMRELEPLLVRDESSGPLNNEITRLCSVLLRRAGLLQPVNVYTEIIWRMHPLVRYWVMDTCDQETFHRMEIFAASMLAASISATSQTYDDYEWRAVMRPYVLGILPRILSAKFASTLSSEAISCFERVCSDCGDLANSRALITTAVNEELARTPNSNTEEAILAKVNLCIRTRKSGQYETARSMLEQQLKKVERADFNPATKERLLARVNREHVTVLGRLGDTDAASRILEKIPKTLKHLNDIDQAPHKLTLEEMEAEIIADHMLMDLVSKDMSDQLGVNHPYTIRTMSKSALLLPKGFTGFAIQQAEAAYDAALEHYGNMYAGTIHAGLALVRCLVNRGGMEDLERAKKLMDDEILAANSISRFGLWSPESLEIRYQCVLIADQLATLNGIKKSKTAHDQQVTELQEILGILRSTHGAKHSTTIRVTLTYIASISDKKEANRQMKLLLEEVRQLLGSKHPEVANIKRLLKGKGLSRWF